MVTISNKWFSVGVAHGSSHKAFITPHSSTVPGANAGLDSPVRKGLFGVTHSKRQHDNPQISAQWATPERWEEDGAMRRHFDYKAKLSPEKTFLFVGLMCPGTSVPSH